jgi:hypothetical protein
MDTGLDEAPNRLSADSQDRIERARVFFAHQSVGENIVDGLKSFQRDASAPSLRIVTMQESSELTGPAFIHAKLGKNGDPKGKTDAFVAALEGGLANSVDIALQKYCFVDFEANTDPRPLFEYYRDSLDRLQQEFPSLRILHVTVPIVVVQSGPRAVVKKWLGRTPDYYPENAVRERFNELMRRHYGPSGRLFDLAALEAARPGADPEPIMFQGQRLYTLLPEYSSDGGHLNREAQRRVASALVSFLASAAPSRGK